MTWRRMTVGGVCLAGAGLTVGWLAAFGAGLDWKLAVFDHLALQVTIGFVVVTALLGALKVWPAMAFFGILGLLQFSSVSGAWFGHHEVEVAHELSIEHLNVGSVDPASLESIAETEADLVSVQELKPQIAEALEASLTDHEIAIAETRTNTQGSAWLVRTDSEWEVASSSVVRLPSEASRPLLELVLGRSADPDDEVALLSLHMPRPQNVELLDSLIDEIGEWSAEHQAEGRRVVLIGDMNMAPWSRAFDRLLDRGELVNGGRGLGLGTTWPSALPAPLRVPIDHVVHDESIETTRRDVGRRGSSDHRSLSVELGLEALDRE